MRVRRKLIALATLAMLFAPGLAHADDSTRKDRCDVPEAQQEEDCKELRRVGFQTKFFSE